MKYCRVCGYQMNDEAKFCLQCGTPATSRASQNNLAQNVPPVQSESVQNNLTQNVPPVQSIPTQNTSAQNTPAQNTPVQNTPIQNRPVQNYPTGSAPIYPSAEPVKKSGWKGIYTVIVILAILMIGAAAMIFVLFNDYKNGDSKADSSSSRRHSSSRDDDDEDDDRSSRKKDKSKAYSDSEEDEEDTEEATEDDIEYEEEATASAESEAIEEAPAYARDMVSSISASSYLIEEDYDIEHEPELAMDGFDDTAWVEDVDGNGIGEYITISFSEECSLEGVSFLNGYQKTDELFEKNGRPSQLKLEFSDGDYEIVDFDDNTGWTSKSFDRIHVTDYVKITILGVYEGTEYDDTCITEIVFN